MIPGSCKERTLACAFASISVQCGETCIELSFSAHKWFPLAVERFSAPVHRSRDVGIRLAQRSNLFGHACIHYSQARNCSNHPGMEKSTRFVKVLLRRHRPPAPTICAVRL
jgi:hypothetical protein